MTESAKPVAVIAGIGPGLGESLARSLVSKGYRVVGLARSLSFGQQLCQELGEASFQILKCDVTEQAQVEQVANHIERNLGPIALYVHNAARLLIAPFSDTSAEDFSALWQVTCLGAFHGVQAVLPGMLQRKSGTLLFIGATASVKGGANFSAFTSAKHALRGLVQSMARELGPQGIHVAHLLVDGVIWGRRAKEDFHMPESACIKPQALADACLYLVEQDPSAWTLELDLRPDVETF